ncbi:uncharacterized [Tachysurus ichikawai]
MHVFVCDDQHYPFLRGVLGAGSCGPQGLEADRGGPPTEELKVFGVPTALIEVSLEWPLGVFSGGHCGLGGF